MPRHRRLTETLLCQRPHLCGIIGFGTWSAMRLPACARVGNTGLDPLTDYIPLALRKHRQEAGEDAPYKRREVEGLRQRDKSHASHRQFAQGRL